MHDFNCSYNAGVLIKIFIEKMLGCFNPYLGQIWTNPNLQFTVESESWCWVNIFKLHF